MMVTVCSKTEKYRKEKKTSNLVNYALLLSQFHEMILRNHKNYRYSILCSNFVNETQKKAPLEVSMVTVCEKTEKYRKNHNIKLSKLCITHHNFMGLYTTES